MLFEPDQVDWAPTCSWNTYIIFLEPSHTHGAQPTPRANNIFSPGHMLGAYLPLGYRKLPRGTGVVTNNRLCLDLEKYISNISTHRRTIKWHEGRVFYTSTQSFQVKLYTILSLVNVNRLQRHRWVNAVGSQIDTSNNVIQTTVSWPQELTVFASSNARL